LAAAQENVDKLADALQMKVLKFDGFGKDFIKKQRLGPNLELNIIRGVTEIPVYFRDIT